MCCVSLPAQCFSAGSAPSSPLLLPTSRHFSAQRASQTLREGVPPPEASQRPSISFPVLQGAGRTLAWPVLQQRSRPWCRRASCCPATTPAKANITPCKFITKSGAEAKHNALLVGGSVETRLFCFFFFPLPSSWKGGEMFLGSSL